MKIFRDDAGVPGAAGGGDQAGDQIGKDAGQNHDLPALPLGEMEELGDFFQVRGNGGGPGNHIEEDVPLGAQQHEGDRTDAQPAAPANQRNQQDGKDRCCRVGGGDLGQRLGDSGQAGVKADGDAGGDGPGGSDEQGGIHAEKSCAGALQQLQYLGTMHMA